MKKTTWVSIIVAAFVFGCAHTHRLDQRPPAAYFDEINKTAQNRKGQIALKSGQVFEGRNLLVASDSTSWLDAKAGDKQRVATSEIKTIVIKNYGKGGLEGLGLGTAVGFVAGFLLTVSADDPCSGCDRTSFGVLIGGIFAVPGGLVGGLTGAASGGKDRFIMPNTPAPSSNK